LLYLSYVLAIKGSVQRKLRRVENSVNPWEKALDHGAGHYFFVLVRLHLFLSIFPFPVSTAQFIGEFWKNRWSATSNVAPAVLVLYRNVIGATLHPALKGKAGQFAVPIGKVRQIFSQRQLEVFADFFYSLGFTYWWSTNRSANTIGAA
jgi:hypothetical protein